MTSRALRVGVLINDNLVEERLFTGSTPITIGQSLRCTLSIPVDGVPHDHVLFAHDQGRTLLRVTAHMDGRLSQGDLRVGPGEGGVWTIPLQPGVRGKLKLGDATILFQEMAAPPLAPRPQLPPSVRGTFADRIDRRLAVIIGASLLAHLGIATWAWVTDRETEELPPLATLRPYHQDVLDITMADEPTIPDAPGVAAPVAAKQTPRPVVQPVTPTGEPGMSTSDANRYAQILTGDDETPRGPGTMRDRQPSADLDQQIRDIVDENRRVQVGGPPGPRPDAPRIGTTPKPSIGDPDQLAHLPGHRDEPTGRIDLVRDPKPPPPTGDTLTAAIVLQKINASYMAGLQRCYRKGMLHDASLAGKVAISFTVDEHGRLIEPKASGMTTEVDACIQGFMPSWRFPFPKDRDGDPSRPSFAMSLMLRPS